uniref:Cuticular protein RR family n=1 Tax=Anopheles atroparvus TaxID=41427 RepID=A0AAG5DRH4_ANOAO
MSAKVFVLLVVLLSVATVCLHAAPQAEKYEAVSNKLLRPEYEYKYEVKDPEKQLFFDKNEAGDTAGKVTGRYSVWLPDGRLMTIKYVVDKEGGFQPEVDFQDNANPLSG